MQVLFKGTPPGEQEYVATCSHCNSAMKFKGEEIRSTFSSTKYIICPVCSHTIFSSSFLKQPQTKRVVPLSVSPDPYDFYKGVKEHRGWHEKHSMPQYPG